jgi:hypothetical protein
LAALRTTPWLWAYRPLRIEARDGQQRGRRDVRVREVDALVGERALGLVHHVERREALVVGDDDQDVRRIGGRLRRRGLALMDPRDQHEGDERPEREREPQSGSHGWWFAGPGVTLASR